MGPNGRIGRAPTLRCCRTAPSRRSGHRPSQTALHIYTSGITGLLKAVNISRARVLGWSLWFAGMMDIGPDDRMYDCLPMHHGIGGVVAVGAMLVHGGSVLIRPGFSASRFWDDVVDGGCTVFQYIGELCRYLVNSPSHLRERARSLRLVCGNGLQAEVWTRFTERFQIPRVLNTTPEKICRITPTMVPALSST